MWSMYSIWRERQERLGLKGDSYKGTPGYFVPWSGESRRKNLCIAINSEVQAGLKMANCLLPPLLPICQHICIPTRMCTPLSPSTAILTNTIWGVGGVTSLTAEIVWATWASGSMSARKYSHFSFMNTPRIYDQMIATIRAIRSCGLIHVG